MFHISPFQSVKTIEDAVTRTMAQTSIHVAETLLRQKALPLPVVHEFFSSCLSEMVKGTNLEGVGDPVSLFTAI